MISFTSDRKLDPFYQALLIFLGAFLLMGSGVVLDKIGLLSMETLYPWSIAAAFLLLFAIFNSLLSITATSTARYWSRSMYSYMGLAAANGLAAWLCSGIPIGEAESYRWIYIVITFGFLVFLSMVNVIKKIVQFAEKEEWHQPRPRRRGRR